MTAIAMAPTAVSHEPLGECMTLAAKGGAAVKTVPLPTTITKSRMAGK